MSSTTDSGTSRPAAATPREETLTLGGGCFWCIEAVYLALAGVTRVVSGYAGGQVDQPSYRAVTSGTTGHAEVIDVTFDLAVLSRDQVLDVFFTVHDPTTPDRQGNDVGPQYRSIVLYRDAAQQAAASAAIARAAASGEWKDPIVTEVAPLAVFWPAEDYHQQYFALHGEAPYCSLVIAPKLAKFRQRHAALLKT